MNTYNPVSFFYFSSCLRLDDEESCLFHSILDTLTSESYSEKEIIYAIKNILICDTPFQIYSLPFVINRLSELNTNNVATNQIVSDYTSLFSSMFDDDKQLLTELFNEIAGIAKSDNTGNKLATLLRSVITDIRNSNYDVQNIPYIDIVEFGKHATILVLLNHFSFNQEIANFFKDLIENNNRELNSFIENAYQHKYGRFCFTLSAYLKEQLLLFKSPDSLFNHIWKNREIFQAPDLEPDIVYLYLNYWFFYLNTDQSSDYKKQQILSELESFRLYSKCTLTFDSQSKEDKYLHNNYHKFIRILTGNKSDVNKFERVELSVNIWIGSICLLVSDSLDVNESSSLLMQFWKPLQNDQPLLRIRSPKKLIMEIIASVINNKLGVGKKIEYPDSINLNSYSPWLLKIQGENSSIRHYWGINNFSNWIRTVYAVHISKTIITKSTAIPDDNFYCYLIHVSDQLSYAKNVSDKEKPPKKFKVNTKIYETYDKKPHLRKLVMQLRRDIEKSVAVGSLKNMDHFTFINKLENATNLSKELEYFYDNVFPNILFKWIYDTSHGTVEYSEIKTFKDKFSKLSKYLNKDLSINKLKVIQKYLFDEQYETNEIDEVKHRHEEILLLSLEGYEELKKLNSNDWFNISSDSSDDKSRKQFYMAIAIQQYIQSVLLDDNNSPIYLETLLKILASLRHNTEISLANRFALLSLFNNLDDFSNTKQDLLKLCIEILFELGDMMDISVICNKILSSIDYVRTNNLSTLQIDLLRCLSNSAIMSYMYCIRERDNPESPVDPLEDIKNNNKLNFLRDVINFLKYISVKMQINMKYRIGEFDFRQFELNAFDTFKNEISVKNDIPTFYSNGVINNPLLSLITYNNSEQTAQFYLRSIPKEVYNLFNMPDDVKRNLLSNQTNKLKVLGICISKKANKDKIEYTFQLDRELFRSQSFTDDTIKIGDPVQLLYKCNETSNRRFIDPNDYRILNQRNNLEYLSIKSFSRIKSLNLNWEYWLPCLSDIYTNYIQKNIPYSIYHTRDFKPVYKFINQLSDDIRTLTSSITLTFVGTEWSMEKREIGYLFYKDFGLNFMLFDDDIDYDKSEDSNYFPDYIANEIRYENTDDFSLNGLLITFEIKIVGTKVTLSLCKNTEKLSATEIDRFPYLNVPYDTRNIDWRTMFDDCENPKFYAKKEGNRWFYSLADKWKDYNFPQKIEVNNLEVHDKNEKIVEFTVNSAWSKYNMRFLHTIEGKIIERRKISSYQLKAYLNLKVGDEVSIKHFLHVNRKTGTIFCLLNDEVKANLDIEELTLIPVDIGEVKLSNRHLKRKFYISSIKSRANTDTKLKITNFEPNLTFVENDEFTAYFVDIPVTTGKKTGNCTIVIHKNGELSDEISVNIENFSDFGNNLAVYSKLVGTYSQGVWNYYLCTQNIYIISSWTLNELEEYNMDTDYFVGYGKINKIQAALFERKQSYGSLSYTYDLSTLKIKNDLYSDIDQLNKNWKSLILGKSTFRIGYSLKNKFISGKVTKPIKNAPYFLTNIKYDINQLSSFEYSVKRILKVEPIELIKHLPKVTNLLSAEEQLIEKLSLIKEYIQSNTLLSGKLIIDKLDVKLDPQFKISKYLDTIPLTFNKNQAIEDFVYVPSVITRYNPDNVHFTLEKDEIDNIYASFKKCEITLEEFFNEFGEIENEPFDISNSRLYFVEKEKAHPITKLPYNEEKYRFERGFGKSILVPLNQLLWDGEPGETGDLQLYHSDAITKFSFVVEKINGIEIVKFNILQFEISQATRLYSQAKQQIYHLAHLGYKSNRLHVKYVKGVDENAIKNNSMVSIYNNISASLDDKSIELLNSRFKATNGEIVVLVKVDTLYFEKTGRLQFNYYSLTFTDSENGINPRAIENGARIIMILGDIGVTSSGNDYYIEVMPSKLLDRRDIGRDFRNGRILRRFFSINEGLLREYFRKSDSKKKAFKYYEVYVTVYQNHRNYRNPVNYHLVNNFFLREGSVLRGLKDTKIIGIARDNINIEQNLVIEVKPGNFVELNSQYIEYVGIDQINKGDVLDISVSENHYKIQSGIASDYRFLKNGRKVVILPKDSSNVEHIENMLTDSEPYTIGGMPNIELDFEKSDIDGINKILSTHHPKIGIICQRNFKNKEIHFLETKGKNFVFAGVFVIDDNTKSIKFKNIELENAPEYFVNLNNLSFYDRSFAEIMKRIINCKWQYHDEKSRDLINMNGKNSFGESYTLLPSSMTESQNYSSGPLFADKKHNEVNFRFDIDLLKWAYPVSTLIDFLDREEKPYTFAYAGSQDNIHFIEIAPGRIVELPVNLLVYRHGDCEITMFNYAWDFLSVGDEITLKNVSEELEDIYKIEILSIRHSFRNIVRNLAKLPVNYTNYEEGFVEIGSGFCQLIFPIPYKHTGYSESNIVEFSKYKNSVLPVKECKLSKGDVVLLKLKGSNEFCFHGFENVKPIYIGSLKKSNIIDIVKQCENALPVYILNEKEDKSFQFSLPSIRNKGKELNGKILSGFIVNSLNDKYNELIVNIGGYVIIVKYDTVISGVPFAYRPFVLNQLVGKQIWLSLNFRNNYTEYELSTGILSNTIGNDFFVIPFKKVLNEGGEFVGTICISDYTQKYYWLPAEEMGWCNITSAIADYVFYNSNEYGIVKKLVSIKVALHKNVYGSCISKIRTTENLNLFRKKRCGYDTIDVFVISEPEIKSNKEVHFIGYSLLYKILVRCITFQSPIPKLSGIIKTEVIEKDLEGLKMKVLWGSKMNKIRIPFYLQNPHRLAKLPNEIDMKINSLIDLNNDDLLESSKEISKYSYDLIGTNKTQTISLRSGFILFYLVCMLHNLQPSSNYGSLIEKLRKLLRLNLLRAISIETINRYEPIKLHDQYLDIILSEQLLEFYKYDIKYMTEFEHQKLKRIAQTLCFHIENEKYPAIGNSILQILGKESILLSGVLNDSLLYKFYNSITNSYIDIGKSIDNEFLGKLKLIIQQIDSNKIEIDLQQELIK